jgi:hypothetical protein
VTHWNSTRDGAAGKRWTPEKLQSVKMDLTQRQIINEFAKMFSEPLEVSEFATRGFLRRALAKWQEKNAMTLSETESKVKSTPEDRIRQCEEILDCFAIEIQDMLQYMPPRKKEILEEKKKDVLAFYTEKYAHR